MLQILDMWIKKTTFVFLVFKKMGVKEKILRKTTEYLIKEGCRKVTVDEIATYNGVSKRTLYELFLDKDDVIEQSLLYCNEKSREYCRNLFSEYDNNIINIVLCGHNFRPNSKLTSAFRLFADAKKNIPDIYANVQDIIREEHREDMRFLLLKGQEEGFLLPDLKIDSLLSLLPAIMKSIGKAGFDTEFPLDHSGMFNLIFVYYIRGISTEKGRMLIDDYLSKNKTNTIE